MRMRNVWILGLCQVLAFSGLPLVLLVGGIVGTRLAPTPALATLPVTVTVIGMALATVPAALLMKRFGRRWGFAVAAVIGAVAALAAAQAIALQSFGLFLASISIIGASIAFVQQYRFAAAESVEAPYVGKAVAIVLAGGIVAGYLGPQLAKTTRAWLPRGDYSASFVVLALLYGAVAVLHLFLQDIKPREQAAAGQERSLRVVAAQPAYLLAVWSATVASGVMAFVMTATPISMTVIDRYALDQTTLVIQAHIMSMYVPSLFSGVLVDRLGPMRLQLLGFLTMAGSVAWSLITLGFYSYLLALILMGIGWNLAFVGATVLLTRSYQPQERFKAQGANDLAIFGIQAVVALLAGWVISAASWRVLNALTLPFLAATLALLLAVRRRVDTER